MPLAGRVPSQRRFRAFSARLPNPAASGDPGRCGGARSGRLASLCGRASRAGGSSAALWLCALAAPSCHRIDSYLPGLLGVFDNDEMSDAVVSCFKDVLTHGQADAVVFHLLAEGHPIWKALAGVKPRPLGLRHQEWAIHRSLDLKPEPGFLVRGMRSKHRSWIKQKEKDLEAAYPGQITWHWLAQNEGLDSLAVETDAVAQAAYQRGLSAGFLRHRLQLERMGLAARRSELRVMLLKIGRLPAAFWLGQIRAGTFYSEATGYRPEFRKHEVGIQMSLRMMDELIRERVRRLDFGLGDAHYKQRFGDDFWREATVQWFAPSLKGRSLRGYVGACASRDRLMRRAASKLSLLDKVKQAWRCSLICKDAGQQMDLVGSRSSL